ncbi:MAG: cysteine desulfurase [Clostridia bacterium]|nr:cysteine desulfurase [Clostridia bacterium]
MIYYDNSATTKPNSDCLKRANKFNDELFYNPSTLYHGGLSVKEEINKSKEYILRCLGALNHEITFTSCGTESNNTAIFCAVKRGVFLTDNGEHASVYNCFLTLKQKGFETVFIDLNNDGSVNTQKLFDYVRNNRVDFISIVHVNNETGAINDVNYIAKVIKSINKNIIFHADGVQAFAKLPYKLSNDIDLYSVSAHKINGLKGTGALIRRKGLNVSPLIIGGGQENNIRSGTENVFGIKVFEYATELHYSLLRENYEKVKKIKDFFIENIDKNLFTVISGDNSIPYILSLSAKGLKGEVIMHSLEMKDIIVGNGSACSSKHKNSRVITACGYGEDVLSGVIRLSFGIENTLDEAKYAVNILNETAKKLKGIMG